MNWYLSGEFLPFLKRVGLRRKDETALHCAVRIATVQTLICISVYLIIAGAIVWLPNIPVGLPHPFLAIFWIGGTNGLIYFSVHLLGPRLMDRIEDAGGHDFHWYILMALGGIFMYCCGLGVLASAAVVVSGPLQQRFFTGIIFLVRSVIVGRLLGCQFYGHGAQHWLTLPSRKE